MVKEVFNLSSLRNLEAVARRCSVKKNMFLEVLQIHRKTPVLECHS